MEEKLNHNSNYLYLSVIVPAHNEEKTICKTLDSLFNQEYKDFEIVVVDDGSLDNTTQKLINNLSLKPESFRKPGWAY